MTMRHALLGTILLAPLSVARAADLDIGVGAALAMDLPDAASGESTRFGPGPSLQIPIRIGLASHARLRTTLRADLGVGSDLVTWGLDIDGEEVRVGSDDHWAMFAAAGWTVGPEVVIPIEGSVAPYLGAEGGLAWVGTYHSFSGASSVVLDPKQNDLQDPNNIDPYTNQLAFLTDVHAGVSVGKEGVGFWSELGYSIAFLRARDLTKSTPGLSARREAYGWNPFRIGAGVSFKL